MTEVDKLFQKIPLHPEQVIERIAFLRQYLIDHPDSALAWAMLGATPSMFCTEARIYGATNEPMNSNQRN